MNVNVKDEEQINKFKLNGAEELFSYIDNKDNKLCVVYPIEEVRKVYDKYYFEIK
jgi:hypothetical protein